VEQDPGWMHDLTSRVCMRMWLYWQYDADVLVAESLPREVLSRDFKHFKAAAGGSVGGDPYAHVRGVVANAARSLLRLEACDKINSCTLTCMGPLRAIKHVAVRFDGVCAEVSQRWARGVTAACVPWRLQCSTGRAVRSAVSRDHR
jgi:hypothetical protein